MSYAATKNLSQESRIWFAVTIKFKEGYGISDRQVDHKMNSFAYMRENLLQRDKMQRDLDRFIDLCVQKRKGD